MLNGGSGQNVFELERDDFERTRDALVIIGGKRSQQAILIDGWRWSI
jgi:hypothetical protein